LNKLSFRNGLENALAQAAWHPAVSHETIVSQSGDDKPLG
jgi:hypothetical protein